MGWCGICIDTATSHTKLNSWRLCKLLPSLVELVLIKRFTCYIYIYIYSWFLFFSPLWASTTGPSRWRRQALDHHIRSFDTSQTLFLISRCPTSPRKETGRYKNGHCSGEHMLGPFTTSVPRSEWPSQDFFKFQESVDAIREGVSYWPS